MKKVLFVSRFVEPNPIGSNRNVFLQAKKLKDLFAIPIEILTWPKDDLWGGPFPKFVGETGLMTIKKEGITYHLFAASDDYDAINGGNILSERNWNEAVLFGIQLLRRIQPSIVHLHHRHGLWWILESAQKLGIPTIYTNHDWGIACLRTVLVMGDNNLCNGEVQPIKCAICIRKGRTSFFGRLNELICSSIIGEKVLSFLDSINFFHQIISKKNIVLINARKRAILSYERAYRAIKNLDHCFVPSSFAAIFFSQLGCVRDRISIMPWYYDRPMSFKKKISHTQPFTITYIGRVSLDKGVQLIFPALQALNDVESIHLKIAGVTDSLFCQDLMRQYGSHVGIHTIEWIGWSKVDTLFESTDVTIIPSQSIDNTPLSLIEAIAFNTPVIATRLPTVEELLIDGDTGYFADFGSIESLSIAIRNALMQKKKIRHGTIKFPSVLTSYEYCSRIADIYKKILNSD